DRGDQDPHGGVEHRQRRRRDGGGVRGAAMAKLFYDVNGFAAPIFKPGTNQNVTVASSSAATTNAFASTTKVIRVASTTACYITLAATPTATTSHMLIPANGEVYIALPGTGLKLAAIRVS